MNTNQDVLIKLPPEATTSAAPKVQLVSLVLINDNWCINVHADLTEKGQNAWYMAILPGMGGPYAKYRVVTDKTSFYKCEEITKGVGNGKPINALRSEAIPTYIAKVVLSAIESFDRDFD